MKRFTLDQFDFGFHTGQTATETTPLWRAFFKKNISYDPDCTSSQLDNINSLLPSCCELFKEHKNAWSRLIYVLHCGKVPKDVPLSLTLDRINSALELLGLLED